MTEQDIISSPLLGAVILQLITINPSFKDSFKAAAPSIGADIESASTNPNCSCTSKVNAYIMANSTVIGSLLYTFAVSNNILSDVEDIFKNIPSAGPTASGKVAKTTIKDWPEFAKGLQQANLIFKHMSTSIVGDDVYVFFL